MTKQTYLKSIVFAAIMAGMTLTHTACGDDDDDTKPEPQKQEQNKDNNENQGNENQGNENQGNENQGKVNQGGETTTKYKISFVVEGETDKIKLSETSKEVADGEKVVISYELEKDYAIYSVGDAWQDKEAKTISYTCYGADKEIVITVKSVYHKVTVSVSFSDGTTEVVKEGNYKDDDEIVYELEDKYKGYFISFVTVSDPSMSRDWDAGKATVKVINSTEDFTVTVSLSECKADLNIYKDNKFFKTLSINKIELNKEYEFDIPTEVASYDYKEGKSTDGIVVKVENGKIKVTVTKYDGFDVDIDFVKPNIPLFTDSKQSIVGKTFAGWKCGFSVVKTEDGIVMNYYEIVNGNVEITKVYKFVRFDQDWVNLFALDNEQFDIYIESEGGNDYKIQKTVHNGSATEIFAITEVESVEAMKTEILSHN